MFCNNHRFRICLFYYPAKFFPKKVIVSGAMPQICGHIQPPAVYIVRGRNPFSRNMHNVFLKFRRIFIIQFRKGIMSPPSIIKLIIWPVMLIVKLEERMVRTVCRNISSLRISLLLLVNPFSVQPFIKRATMVKYTIQNNLHTSFMNLFYQFNKKCVAGFQILFICHPVNITTGMAIVPISRIKKFSLIFHNFSIMGIYIIIILNVIFMIRRRYEYRIQINHFYSQILKVIQFIHNSLKISSIEVLHIQIIRQFSPVFHPVTGAINIIIFSRKYIIGGISIAKTIHENLIHYCSFCPIRRFKPWNDTKRILLLQLS